MYTCYFKERRQFLTQSSSIELLHLITKCATGRRSFVCPDASERNQTRIPHMFQRQCIFYILHTGKQFRPRSARNVFPPRGIA